MTKDIEAISEYLDPLIDLALKEDISDGDHTSLACIPKNTTGKVDLLVKQNGIIAGVNVANYIINKFDSSIKIKTLINDGSVVKNGDIVIKMDGNAINLLTIERLILNIMQRMSGIATITNIYAKELAGLNTKVIDTRKTAPGLRVLDKLAVKLGGGENHRMGLFDMILIKDNHIDFAGGNKNAIDNALEYLKKNNKPHLKIEIEARTLNDVKEIIEVGGEGKVNRIMLDNFTVEDTKKAVELINSKFEVESSGGITLENLRDYAMCGVNYISVGALTHQVKSLDLSLKASYD